MEGNGEISDTDSGIILNSGKSTSSSQDFFSEFLILTFTGRLILHLTLAQESLKHFFLEVKASSFLALHHAKNAKVVGFEVSLTLMRNLEPRCYEPFKSAQQQKQAHCFIYYTPVWPQFLINIHRKTSTCEDHDLKRLGHVTNKIWIACFIVCLRILWLGKQLKQVQMI